MTTTLTVPKQTANTKNNHKQAFTNGRSSHVSHLTNWQANRFITFVLDSVATCYSSIPHLRDTVASLKYSHTHTHAHASIKLLIKVRAHSSPGRWWSSRSAKQWPSLAAFDWLPFVFDAKSWSCPYCKLCIKETSDGHTRAHQVNKYS